MTELKISDDDPREIMCFSVDEAGRLTTTLRDGSRHTLDADKSSALIGDLAMLFDVRFLTHRNAKFVRELVSRHDGPDELTFRLEAIGND